MTFPIYTDKNLGICAEMGINVWDNGGRNTKLDQAEVIDMGPQRRGSRFNAEACGVRL